MLRNALMKYKSFPVQVKAAFWFLICSFLQKGVSMITTPIFTRLLTPAEYGAFGVFTSWQSIATVIVTLSLSAGVYTQGLIKFDKDRAVFSSSMQGMMTGLVALWTVIYLISRSFWNERLSLTTTQMFSLLILIWSTSVFNFWANEQRVLYKYKTLVIISLLVAVANPALGVFLVLHAEDKVTARILGLVLVELIAYSWMYVVQMKRGKVFFSSRYWKYALLFNLPLVPHYLSQTVLSSADRIMIKNIVGDGAAGIYNLAYSVALIMVLFNTALMQTISPWIYQKIKDRTIKEIAPVAYTTLILIASVNLFLILLAPDVVAIFAPKSYYEAIWVIPPVAMSVFFMYCYDLFAKFAFYYEKTMFVMIASILGAILNVILNFVFIPLFGYYAAGYTTLLCYLMYAMAHYYFMRKTCRSHCDGIYPYSTKVLMSITIPFLAFGFLFLTTYNHSLLRYGLVLAILIVAVLFRKRIWGTVASLLQIRKAK